MVRPRALSRMFAAALACAAAGMALTPGTSLGRRSPQQPPAPLVPLLPLARGQLLVSLGDPPSWRPVAGRPLTVTLFSGRPGPRTAHLNAYVGFQSPNKVCPAAPRGDRGSLLTIHDYFKPADLLTSASAFSPGGGTPAGEYAVSIPGVVVQGIGQIRACMWIARSPRRRVPFTVQDIPLLNGVLAASVSDVPSAVPGATSAYTLDAVGVGVSFSYSVASSECGVASGSPATHIAPGALATTSISLLSAPCATDSGQFTLSTAAGQVGVLSYPATDARVTPPVVVTLGACELDPVSVTTIAAAIQYVESDGCTVGRLLVGPYTAGLPLGAVVEAQVDGGIAQVAPFGTPVDLVLNGRPAGS